MRRLRTVLPVIALIGAGIGILRPDQLVYSRWESSQATRLERERIASAWGELAEGPRLDGNAGEPAVVVFTDYECPYCRSADADLHLLMSEAPHVGIVVRNFPNPWEHRQSIAAAVAARCADRQGVFAEMHVQLFRSTEWRLDGDWKREAQQAGVADLDSFLSCIREREVVESVGQDLELGIELGVSGTPAFVFPTGRVANGISGEDMRRELGL